MSVCNSESVEFKACGALKVVADFSGGHVTSDAGVLLLREADERLKLCESAAAVIPDPRNPAKIQHSQISILQQRVFGLALGYEDVIDHDSLCNDFAFQTATGRDQKLAGASTVGRLEHRCERSTMWDMHRVLLDTFFAAHAVAPQEIVLDLDSTDFTVHGQQEGRSFNAYYDDNIFLPLYIFCGRHLLVSYLAWARRQYKARDADHENTRRRN